MLRAEALVDCGSSSLGGVATRNHDYLRRYTRKSFVGLRSFCRRDVDMVAFDFSVLKMSSPGVRNDFI